MRPLNKAAWAALTIAVAVSPIIYLPWPSVWADDVPAVISEINSPGRHEYYRVELTEPLPSDALNPTFDGGLWFPDRSVVPEELEGARVGEPVTCHVRQVNGLHEMAIGPQTKITSCWR